MTRKIKSIKNLQTLINFVERVADAHYPYNRVIEFDVAKEARAVIKAASIEYEPEPIEFTQRWYPNTGEMPQICPQLFVEVRHKMCWTEMGTVESFKWNSTEQRPSTITHWTPDIFNPEKGGA